MAANLITGGGADWVDGSTFFIPDRHGPGGKPQSLEELIEDRKVRENEIPWFAGSIDPRQYHVLYRTGLWATRADDGRVEFCLTPDWFDPEQFAAWKPHIMPPPCDLDTNIETTAPDK